MTWRLAALLNQLRKRPSLIVNQHVKIAKPELKAFEANLHEAVTTGRTTMTSPQAVSTLFYPDLSDHQHGIAVTSAKAVCEKATEGHTYTNPDYARVKTAAAKAGIFFFAYHFLRQGDAAAQAQHCFSVVGKGVGLMVDVEETTSSQPTIADEVTFIDQYRKLGGTVWLDYVPHWYWQKIGSPSMQPLINRGLLLVSSAYTTYTDADTGAGWQPYGGRKPVVWQYTDKHRFNGFNVDFNAYRGSLAGFRSLVLTGKLPSADPAPFPSGRHVVDADSPGTLAGLAKRQGCQVADIWWVTAAADAAVVGTPPVAVPGAHPGSLQRAYLNAGKWDETMPAGMILWLP